MVWHQRKNEGDDNESDQGKSLGTDFHSFKKETDLSRAAGKAGSGYQRIKKFHDLIDDEDFRKTLLLEAAANKSAAFELKKLQKAINELITDLGK